MRFKKVYGASKVDKCPFCGKQAVTENSAGVPVCLTHKDASLPELKCICGEWLDVQSGKFGPYFRCMRCGNVSWSKAMRANPDFEAAVQGSQQKPQARQNEPSKASVQQAAPSSPKQFKPESSEKKETVIRSDELDFYF